MAQSNHRTTLPQSRPCGRASSLREGAGNGWCHSTYRPGTGRLRAIFIAPTELRGGYISPFIGGHSLSQPLRADSSLREGAGIGQYHSTYRPETGRVRAIFIAPTKTQGIFTFYHRERTFSSVVTGGKIRCNRNEQTASGKLSRSNDCGIIQKSELILCQFALFLRYPVTVFISNSSGTYFARTASYCC